ncbi:peptide chain release factor N(5)-glutamine methyltransferase [Flavobacteriaceae bacterium S356]|uniref:Release factor glutamine methyltransferase n=1 Tax=Asprobacillus argus TaxID=3076534 RepID=A0ABU3LH09_9FLAO|nr:peptide chain release factor N(5)-glutamine methyltransferase [Flavobacteriaceae bacterium S356]
MMLKTYKQHFKTSLSSLYPDAEIDSFFFLLIEEYLGLQRIDISLQPNFEIDSSQQNKLDGALQRLQKEEPVQYILRKTEFYGLPLLVNTHTLIPRPETEELVEWILNDLTSNSIQDSLEILDVGTGSGCIPISIGKNNASTNISAIDISSKALEVAKKNARLNEVSIDFIQTDILKTNQLPKKYDLIVSNPPYVRELEKIEIKKNVLENEPHVALFVKDNNPLLFYHKIADLAKEALKKEGALYFEINQYLGKETVALLQTKGFKKVTLRKDLFGNDRMVKAQL